MIKVGTTVIESILKTPKEKSTNNVIDLPLSNEVLNSNKGKFDPSNTKI